jgi:peroxiredoxin
MRRVISRWMGLALKRLMWIFAAAILCASIVSFTFAHAASDTDESDSDAEWIRLDTPQPTPASAPSVSSGTASTQWTHVDAKTYKPDPKVASAAMSVSQAFSGGGPHSGMIAPDFTLPDVNGQAVSLSSMHGKTVVLNFWNRQCDACREQLQSIQKLYLDKRQSNIAVITVVVNNDRNRPVAPFIANAGYTFPVLLDNQGQVSKQWNIQSVPTSVMLNPDGQVIFEHRGPMNWSDYRVRQALAKISN